MSKHMPRNQGSHSPDSLNTDYYRILGVSINADISQIRAEYLAKARLYHPDSLVGQSKEQLEQAGIHMAQLNKAWEVLSDPVTRQRYDLLVRANSYKPDLAGNAANKVGRFLGKLYSEYAKGRKS